MRNFEIGRRAEWLRLLTFFAVLAARNSWCADSPAESTDPLLNLFIQKGYVTQAEAAKVKAEADQLRTNDLASLTPPASNWKVSSGIKNMEVFGDIRLRYEDRSATDPAGNKIDLARMRYSLRFGLRGDLYDDFYFGFRMETGASPRSPWVTMGTSSSGNSPYQGPYGKSTAGINVGQIYLGWHPQDWVDITAGKMPNPLYTTPMVWSANLNPEGVAEKFKYSVGEADFFGNFGQFVYADLNPNTADQGLGVNGLTGQNTDNVFMFAWQGGLNYHITPTVSAKVAGTIYNYTHLKSSSQQPNGGGLSPYFGDPYVGEGSYYYSGGAAHGYAPGYAGYSPGTQFNYGANGGYGSVSYPFNQVGLNNLLVLEIPFEINFKISKLATRLFGDVAYNLDGSQRAQDAASAYNTISTQDPGPTTIPHTISAQTQDVKAYQFGFGIGSTNFVAGPSQGVVYGSASSKHAWEFRTYWQHIEQYSLDPNLIDTDFFEGRENMQGIYTALAYCFSGNVYGAVRYGYAKRINDQLGTGGSNQDIPQMNPINSYSIFQVDLGVRF